MADEQQTVPLAIITALFDGERALAVDAAALTLGVPARTFRKLAARPGFPRPAKMGKRLTWNRVELMDWWKAERDRQNKAA